MSLNVAPVDRRTLFEHDDDEARACEHVRRHGATGARTHDDDVRHDVGVGHLGIGDHRQVDGRGRTGGSQRDQGRAVVADERRDLRLRGVRELDEGFEPGQRLAPGPEARRAARHHPGTPIVGVEAVKELVRPSQKSRQVKAAQHCAH